MTYLLYEVIKPLGFQGYLIAFIVTVLIVVILQIALNKFKVDHVWSTENPDQMFMIAFSYGMWLPVTYPLTDLFLLALIGRWLFERRGN